ncbi:MAG: hypothetical protein KA831_02105 [Pyrinomonadaceae bacterium]|nr:hypothetical protein [Pyrinomonadaceae bacterium]
MVARVIIWGSIAFAILLFGLSFVFLFMELRSGSDTGVIVLPFWFLALIFLIIAAGTYIAVRNKRSKGISLDL